MKKVTFIFACVITAVFVGGINVWADEPVFPAWGADAAPDLYSPAIAGQGTFVTGTGGGPVSAINPAQGGAAERMVFDIGYFGLAGLGNESGYGNAVGLGTLFPTRYGVFGGSLRFIQSPFDQSFPIKWAFSGNLNAAKEVYPGISVGAGLNFGVGGDSIWTLSGDLGFRWNMGSLGPLENFTWAATLMGLGKSWTPTWFTPTAGVSFDVLRVKGKDGKKDPFVLNTAADMSFPSLFYFPRTSAIFKFGLNMEIAEFVKLSLTWPGGSGINVRELAEGVTFNPIPSVGLRFNFVLPASKKRIIGGKLPSDGNLAVDLAYKPLYYGVSAFGAGATWTAGIADTKPPVLELDYPETLYYSPNNDGKADYLEFPVSFTDERYIESWVWEIRDEQGNTVRTYRNKELRPETQGVKNFFSRLFAVKTQVEVPPSLRWDGIGDSGETMPDGKYYFTVSAVDDRGNSGESTVFEAILDNTPPEIAVETMTDSEKVFSPGGGGSKNTIMFRPAGGTEEAWESGVYNSSGDKIRSFEAESGVPVPREWDGRDDTGAIVPDGVYSYRIGSTDRAGNSSAAALGNIIVNTIRPEVNVFIADPYFSPNGDGIKDTVIAGLIVPVKEEVTAWTIRIQDRGGNVRRTITNGREATVGSTWTEVGQDKTAVIMPERIEFDGKDDFWTALEEADYTAELSVQYLNGYTATAVSPPFTLDITPPSANAVSEYSAFSPTYGGRQSEMLIRQEGSRELLWMGDVRRATGTSGERPVRSFRFGGSLPFEVRWDGHGDSGTFAADGEYIYQLTATDQAGNTGKSNELRFRLSTADTPVMIGADPRAFSPNGDGAKDTVTITPQAQVREGIIAYKLDLLDEAGGIVRTFEGRGAPPPSFAWNGRTEANAAAAEGPYTAKIELRYEQGNTPSAVSLPFILDLIPPSGTVSAPYTVFSPNGKRNTIPFTVTTEADDQWEAAVTGTGGTPVRTWSWKGPAPGIYWDGRDTAGNAAPDGTYQFSLQSVDEAGNTAKYDISGIVLDSRVPRLILTSSETAIAPKTGAAADLVRFNIVGSLREGIESWALELKNEEGALLKRFGEDAAGGTAVTLPQTIAWDGLSGEGAVREGLFTPALTVNYSKGDTVTADALPILINLTGPELSFSYRPQYFSPDNDGVEDDLYINLEAKSPSPIGSWSLEIREPVPPNLLFYRIEGKGSPSGTVIWDGRSNKGELVQAATDYPVTFSATDELGNTTVKEAKIGVDVMVIRDGNRLRILIPSIVFRENAADFNGIPDDRSENNRRVLRRIAEILNKFRDYRVQVEGHANPVLLTAREEREELQPLSEARAKTVVSMLIEFGVVRSRLSSVGMGGTRTVISHADRDNWWKNRRVEFLLIK